MTMQSLSPASQQTILPFQDHPLSLTPLSKELCVPEALQITMKIPLSDVTDKQPFEDHLLSIILWTPGPLCPRRPNNEHAESLQSVTNKWPFQDHLPSITLLNPGVRFHFVSGFKDTLLYMGIIV